VELYIRILDGKPFEHPIFAENFKAAFPDVDVANLPSEFAKFERVKKPALGVYEKSQTLQYVVGVDGICRDVWSVEAITDEEKTAKQQAVKDTWAANNGPESWVFDEASCAYIPPVPYPTNGKVYEWDEPTTSWIEVTE
jgi:hypothetical protein